MCEDRTFDFSVIISVYNREKYLNECIDSVIQQSIGFENIQLILVNNASVDGSADICLEYQSRYPENIVYVELKENVGPEGGRRAGIPYIKGTLVNFLDSDDKWGLQVFEIVQKFFSKHESEIDCIACRVKAFGRSSGWHALDYVFSNDHIVNIHDQHNQIQTRVASAFITADAVKATPMDTGIICNEDTLYITNIILKKGRFGVLRSAIYYYRRHDDSLMDVTNSSEFYFKEQLFNFHDRLIRESLEKYDQVIPFLQYEIMYDLQWRLLSAIPQFLTPDDIQEYVGRIQKLLMQIDDYIIFEQRNIYKEHKLFCLRLKYGDEIYERFKLISGKFLFQNLPWFTADNRSIFNYFWHGVNDDGIMRLTGEINLPLPQNDYEIFAEDSNGNRYPLTYDEREKKKLSLGQECLTIRHFEIVMPIDNVSSINFFLRYQNAELPLYINTGKFSLLSMDPPESFSVIRGYIFSCDSSRILIEKKTRSKVRAHKRALWRGLFKRKDKCAIACRFFAAILKKLSGKQDIRISFGNQRIV